MNGLKTEISRMLHAAMKETDVRERIELECEAAFLSQFVGTNMINLIMEKEVNNKMQDYVGFYLPMKRSRKVKEQLFKADSDLQAEGHFEYLCEVNGWRLINVQNPKGELLYELSLR